jgi:hypothetical protein
MIIKNPNNYKFLKFEVAHNKKKYNALLLNTITNRIVKVGFGDKSYQQFFDKIGHYKTLNHNDPIRRKAYHDRHRKDINNKYSSGWFSYHFLW